jgi:hypothetical protein
MAWHVFVRPVRKIRAIAMSRDYSTQKTVGPIKGFLYVRLCALNIGTDRYKLPRCTESLLEELVEQNFPDCCDGAALEGDGAFREMSTGFEILRGGGKPTRLGQANHPVDCSIKRSQINELRHVLTMHFPAGL